MPVEGGARRARLSPLPLESPGFKVAFTSSELTAQRPRGTEQPGFRGPEGRFSQTTNEFPDVLEPHGAVVEVT